VGNNYTYRKQSSRRATKENKMKNSKIHAYFVTNASKTLSITVFAKNMNEAADWIWTFVSKRSHLSLKMVK
jgi:hypothetical protein